MKKMLSKDRQDRILDLLSEKGRLSYHELTEKLNCSQATIRRDVEELEKKLSVFKISGGIELRRVNEDIELNYRKVKNISSKIKISKIASKLIKDNMTIFLDSGSTVEQLIPYIKDKNIKIVTNSISHMNKLSEFNIDVFILGGRFKKRTYALVGSTTIKQIQRFLFDISFIGANAVSKEIGYMTPDIEEATVKSTVIENSKISYILADKTKLSKESNVIFARYNECILITEEGTDDIHSNT